MQDLVLGRRSLGPGLGKANRTLKRHQAPGFERERNSSYLLVGAGKGEHTECELAGAAALLLHPWPRLSRRKE